jgi:hypothetical protein
VTDLYAFYNTGRSSAPDLPDPPYPNRVKAFVIACCIYLDELTERAHRAAGEGL